MKIKAKKRFISGRFEASLGQILEVENARGVLLVSDGLATEVKDKTETEAAEPKKK
ncbi:MAG: hypothetical protein MR671_01590 [Clostridiales bacterium]|nr:hypothetical protein [Clostridiales bacterium]